MVGLGMASPPLSPPLRKAVIVAVVAADNEDNMPEPQTGSPSVNPANTARAGGVGEIRANHRFDITALEAWCRAHIEDFGEALAVRQFHGGASNPTFLLTTRRDGAEVRYVMRKKPPGTLLASAHQVDREYRVMAALGPTGFPAPRMRALCEDASVIGTAFYVMDHMEGRIFRSARLPDLTPAERAATYDALNANLARLHAIDYRAIGLEDYGRPGNFYERQITRWTRQYRGAQTENIPDMERLIEALPARIPADDTTTIAHGDYRPENVMFHPTEPRIIAVLDWELSTIGHPLADLAFNCILYHSHSESFGSLIGEDFAATGVPSEADYVAAYCRRTGRDGIADWNFYLGFSLFRLASIGQGVFKRNLDGIGGADAGEGGNAGTWQLAETAWSVLTR
jgi:aminoglycoside phosphotransferase (APT) family kinase protein